MNPTRHGQCHLCGENGQLTFEHVPPRSAFNKRRAHLYGGKGLFEKDSFPWDFTDVQPETLQRGIGWFTLCGKCNHDTGGWYARAFADFVYEGFNATGTLSGAINRSWVELHLRNVYPLRVAKQVITMFCSVNHARFFDVHEELRAFVLNKDRRGLDPKRYGLYAYVLVGGMARYIGLSGIATMGADSVRTRLLSELAAPPFGFVLEINPSEHHKYCDMLSFANNFSYGDNRNLTLKMPVYESNTPYPADYRSRQEVMNTYIENTLAEARRQQQTSR